MHTVFVMVNVTANVTVKCLTVGGGVWDWGGFWVTLGYAFKGTSSIRALFI